jgi:hypothetical protein
MFLRSSGIYLQAHTALLPRKPASVSVLRRCVLNFVKFTNKVLILDF